MKPSGRSGLEPRHFAGVAIVAAMLGAGELKPSSWRPQPAPKAPGELAFSLEEISEPAGLSNTHERLAVHPSLSNIAPWIKAMGGASAAVVDFDGDGWPDVYVTNSAPGSKNRLFRNKGDGTFVDVAARAGLADVNRDAGSLRALFFDFDDDGDKDLLLTTTYCPRLFRNDGKGVFTDVTAGSGLDHCAYASAANAVDYDGDGRLDLVIADYYKPVDLLSPRTTKFMPNSFSFADNGGGIAVYRNLGGGRFAAVPGALGIKGRGWTLALGVYDLRGTGRPDLYFSTDFGYDFAYLNEGGGRFRDVSPALTTNYGNHGMNAEAADVDNDGRAAVYSTSIYEPGRILGENTLWGADASGGFRNLARERGVNRCLWSWGAKFLDLDNDGWQDLIVTNGFISADPKKSFWGFHAAMDRSTGRFTEDALMWPPVGQASVGGYQRKCMYRNAGGGRFEDISAATPFGQDASDGRALAVIDYLNNGSLAFVEANYAQPLRFYRTVQKNSNRWIGFALTGTKGGRDAWGSRLTVRLRDGRTLSRQLQPANAYLSQSDARLHFGLGAAAELEAVTVRWPGGREESLDPAALSMGRYNAVREPAR